MTSSALAALPSSGSALTAPRPVPAAWMGALRTDLLDEGLAVSRLCFRPDADLRFAAEGPPSFSLTVFLHGEGSFALDTGKTVPFHPGTAVMFDSARAVRGENSLRAGSLIDMVTIRLDREALVRLCGTEVALCAEPSGAEMIGFTASPALLDAAREIAGCSYAEDGLRRLYLTGKALVAVALSLSALGEPAPAPSKDRQRIDLARILLHERYEEPWTVAGLARAVGLGEKRLKAGFRDFVGQTPHAYLREVRLKAAASLLADGAQVTEAAYAVGFGNLSHFAKSFKDSHGVAPSRYRVRQA